MKKLFLFFTLSVVFISLILAAGINVKEDEDKKDWSAILDYLRAEIVENGYTYTVDYNETCQYTTDQLWGFKPEFSSVLENGPALKKPQKLLGKELPNRYIGYYTSIKNQGGCGSCWAFGMVGAVEGLFLKTMGTEENLSEQWLLDCNPWSWNCQGGFINFYMFLYEGAITESCYPYVGYKKACNYSCPNLYFIYDWDWVYNSSSVPPVNDIKQAILDYGSVCVGIHANTSFQMYSGGVYNNCVSNPPNHAVVLCGWDDNLGAWLLKNSWGPSWGGVDIDESGQVDPDEEGFMWIVYGCNNVGYAAAYPIPYYGG
jgi:hypothetical protein